MRLRTEDLQRFKGGQMEIQNGLRNYLFRGEISEICIKSNLLGVSFVWMAECRGYPRHDMRWVLSNRLEYIASLEIYAVCDLGPGDTGGGRRIFIQSPVVGESATLFPPDGSRLDPALVEGFCPVQ